MTRARNAAVSIRPTCSAWRRQDAIALDSVPRSAQKPSARRSLPPAIDRGLDRDPQVAPQLRQPPRFPPLAAVESRPDALPCRALPPRRTPQGAHHVQEYDPRLRLRTGPGAMRSSPSTGAITSWNASRRAGWARSSSPTTPCWRARSRSRYCTARSPATRRSWTGSGARRAPRRGCRIPTSSPSTTGAPSTASTTWSWSTSAAAPPASCLNASGRLEPAQAAEIVRQTLRALGHAHRQGLRPPRHQAREHPGHHRRRREGHGLRPRARLRRGSPDAGRHGDRHRPVPRARADPRRARRPAQRPLLAGRS